MQLYTNLMSADVNVSLAFYELLGFEVLKRLPDDGECHWALMGHEETKIMFQSASSLKAEFRQLEEQDDGGALTLWIQVENPAILFEEVKEKVKVLKTLGVTSYNGATEFVIQDPNGFILQFSDLDVNTL
jgi:catechol 2,3-dioxygenase-like lactoylglutathione lyase family enzyme